MPVTLLKADAKRGVRDIPRLIESGTQVLSFKLGYSGYYGPAIWMYFNHLIKSPTFKYALIIDQPGSLFGLFDVRKLTATLNSGNNAELIKNFLLESFRGLPDQQQVSKWSRFAQRIRSNKTFKLSDMTGFVSLQKAVKPTADKKRVLERMEKQGLDWLPVVKKENTIHRFQGIVERSRLTASLILDITNQLENKKKEQKN
jgi:CBS domain-containing protein